MKQKLLVKLVSTKQGMKSYLSYDDNGNYIIVSKRDAKPFMYSEIAQIPTHFEVARLEVYNEDPNS